MRLPPDRGDALLTEIVGICHRKMATSANYI